MDNMQLWLSSSTDSINLNDRLEGFYLNPDLDGLTGLPEIRSVNGLNAGYDGGWTATQLWAARLITIRGVIAINDKAAVETKRKALAKLLSQGKNEDLELKFVSEAGNTYTATVRTTNCTMALQRVFWRQEYQIQLRANDPLIYDDGGSELVAILRVMSGEGGFEIPFDIPFDIGGTVTPTSVDVGDEATYPLIRLKGDLHNPTIISLTTNQRMQVLADIITTTEWHDYTTAYTTNGYAQINSTEEGAPLSLTHLYGNAEQKTLSGKNICSNATVAGNTSIRFYFDKTNSTNIVLSAITNATTDRASVYLVVDSTEIARIGAFSGGANQRGSAILTLTQTQIDAIQAGASSWLNLYVGGGDFASVSEAQIESGSSMTAYEPYCGGIPSPNPDFPQEIKTVTGAQTVKITGKNIFDKDSVSPINAYIASNGSIGYSAPDKLVSVPVMPNTTYTITAQRVGQIPEQYLDDFAGALFTSDTAPIVGSAGRRVFWGAQATNPTLNQTFTTSATENWLAIKVANVQRSDYADTLATIQLEINDQATPFEPYQAQSQEINLGKNLLNITNTTPTTTNGITFTPNSDGSIKVSGTATATAWFVMNSTLTLPNGTYTYSSHNSTLSAGTAVLYNDTFGYTTESKTMTLTSGTTGNWSIRVASGATIDTIVYPMVEIGAEMTDFAPYKTPLEFAKIGTYQDYIWNDEGIWKIHKEVGKVVLDGTEAWGAIWGNTAGLWTSNVSIGAEVVQGNDVGISDHFTYKWSYNSNTPCFYVYNQSGQGRIMVIQSFTSDLDTYKAWLSTHNTTVYYALSTPTDTEITDSELIEQLNHIYELYQGTNNVMLIPNAGAQGEMTVTYATAVDRDYHEVVIDCQARTVTQDGRNLYPALADGSEFIRLLPGENRLYLTSEVESDNGTAEVKFKKGNISI